MLRDGDCQWMTAASGIEHNEGTGHPGGMLHGFQCWINLPAARKMDPPAYKELRYEKQRPIWPIPARPKRLIGRGWAKLRAACNAIWR